MKHFTIALLLAGACAKQSENPPETVATAPAPARAHDAGAAGSVLDELVAVRDRACACTDAACANAAAQALDDWLAAHRDDRGSSSDAQRATELGNAIGECTSAILRAPDGPDGEPVVAEVYVGTGPDGEEDPPAYLKLASGENLLKVAEWVPQRPNGDPADFIAIAIVEAGGKASLVFQPEFDKRTTLAYSIPEEGGDALDYASPVIEWRPHHSVIVELTTGSLHMEDRTEKVFLVEWNAKKHVPRTIRHWVGQLPDEPDWVHPAG
jgi:hypothetical protein